MLLSVSAERTAVTKGVAMKDRLMMDLKEAMKAKDTLRKDTITLLRSAIKQIEVDERRSLEEPEILQIIQKQIGQRKKAIDEFKKGAREDLVQQALSEIAILETYLPEPMGEEELRLALEEIIASEGATTMKDMGKVMAIASERFAGQADKGLMSQIVRDNLSKGK